MRIGNREYMIYFNGDSATMSPAQRKVVAEVQDRINNDEEIMTRSMKINKEFSERIRKISNEPGNEYFLSGMIENIKREVPRYSFIKNVDFAGTPADVEIDELMRAFRIIEREEKQL